MGRGNSQIDVCAIIKQPYPEGSEWYIDTLE